MTGNHPWINGLVVSGGGTEASETGPFAPARRVAAGEMTLRNRGGVLSRREIAPRSFIKRGALSHELAPAEHYTSASARTGLPDPVRVFNPPMTMVGSAPLPPRVN